MSHAVSRRINFRCKLERLAKVKALAIATLTSVISNTYVIGSLINWPVSMAKPLGKPGDFANTAMQQLTYAQWPNCHSFTRGCVWSTQPRHQLAQK